MMTALRNEGLIDYSRNRFVIKDVAALSDICGMEPEDIPSLRSTSGYGEP
jgi:hypothetical protein